jgi:hypothetical protein
MAGDPGELHDPARDASAPREEEKRSTPVVIALLSKLDEPADVRLDAELLGCSNEEGLPVMSLTYGDDRADRRQRAVRHETACHTIPSRLPPSTLR